MDQPTEELLSALRSGPVTVELLQQANHLGEKTYWEKKDAETCHLILKEATAASRTPDSHDPDDLIAIQRIWLLYNLASYGWLGWAEPGIALSPDFQRDAVDAAREHYASVQVRNFPPLKRSRAAWLLGALLIQDGDARSAKERFLEAQRLAEEAEWAQGDVLNAQAFILTCDALCGDAAAEVKLTEHTAAMRQWEKEEDDASLADQAPTALQVFRPLFQRG